MPDTGKTNMLYVLMNGEPNEWALRTNVERDSTDRFVWVAKFTDVPDEVVERLRDGAEPSQLWEEIKDLPSELIQ